jgi:geranylgeranyl pyrophosphate synthase
MGASLLEWDSLIKQSNDLLSEYTDRYTKIFDEFLNEHYKKTLGSNALTEKVLSPAIRNSVLKGGKRIRPALSLLSCEAISGSGSYARALPVALAFELAHCASLVQDDIFDNASLRRGRPTLYQSLGAVTAILSSDYIIFEIFRAITSYEHVKISKSKVMKMLSYIVDAAQGTIQGELMDVALSQNTEIPPSQKEYIELIGLKTAQLFAASTALGALAGGATKGKTDAMYEYGYNLGLAFQILDDVLDIIGSITMTGKMPLKDLENNSSNIVIIHALSATDRSKKAMVRSMLWKKTIPADVQYLTTVLNELGSIEYALSLAAKFNEKARRALKSIPDTPARKVLEKLSLTPYSITPASSAQ